ncbi:MAG: aminotransferase class I/II-fold pyridoxal phosphate-dependent enzyme, partial [Alphaproteobacteria bacterium]|nr:aminotransferase class I/II-fold pyridoxal phosphate-dependent enzyme [Alphaproteobacteria bacterium]
MRLSDFEINDGMGRLGTESAFEVLARANEITREGYEVINLGIGQPDFRTPEHVVEAAKKALDDGHHGYAPGNGILPLREAVAADIATYRGVTIDPDTVVIVPGGKVTMWYAILIFGGPGTEIMYPNPGFPIYESVIRYSGAKPVPIALSEENGFAFDANEVLAQITPATRLIILNSPANPTGGVVPREQFDKLVDGLEAHPQVTVMSDEIYARLLYDNT